MIAELPEQYKNLKGKLLYIDCETSLIHLYAHCIGHNQHVGHHQIKQDKKVITICYMVEGDKKAKSLVWDKNQDDRHLLNQFIELASKYPVIVAQNGDSFDIKVIRGRCWLNDAASLPELTTLDTLKMARQNFRLTSNRLDYMSKAIEGGGKLPTDFQLWIDVENGNKKALKKMVEYCKEDVLVLREVFLSMLPYCAKLPHHLGVLTSSSTKDGCSKCGSTEKRKDGFRFRGKGKYQKYNCMNCGNTYIGTTNLAKI